MTKKLLSKGNPNVTFIEVKLKNKSYPAYIDTGATFCFGSKRISKVWQRLAQPKEIIIADQSKHYIHFVLHNLIVSINSHDFIIPSLYLHESGLDIIIGNNFLKLYEPFIQRKNIVQLGWKNLSNPSEKKLISTEIITRNEIVKMITERFSLIQGTISSILFYKTIEQELEEVCSDHPLDELKNTNSELIEIKLKDPLAEINIPNRIPYTIRDVEEFQTECKDLLEKGLIRPSKSPHSAPAFYVENHNEIKRGKRRMVINYKKMNDATIGDSYKLPRKDFIFEKIKGCNWFSSLDAKSGYYQLRLHENTKPLTAFSCPPQKQYEWNVLSFGLKQAPSIYQRFMDQSLQGLESICLAYIDDILIFTKGSSEKHMEDVKTVLHRIKEKGIVISQKKSKLMKQEIEFLGTIIQQSGTISLAPHVQEKIKLFPDELTDRKQIQRFLGCLNYISNEGYLKNLSEERKILQKKISEKIPWKWTEKDSAVVRSLKSKISVLPELYNPTEKDFLIIETDASQTVWAGCMRALPNGKSILGLDSLGNELPESSDQPGVKGSYEINNACSKNIEHYQQSLSNQVIKQLTLHSKDLRLCKYVSGTFSDTETRYHITELEVLAGVKVLEKWRIDLLATRFVLRTDSKYFAGFWRYQIKTDYRNGRLIRWQLKLQQFQPYLQLIKSEANSFSDTLTREWSQS